MAPYPASAASCSVFNLYELVEAIFKALPLQQVVELRWLNQTSASVLRSSKILRQKLFLDSIAKPAPAATNTEFLADLYHLLNPLIFPQTIASSKSNGRGRLDSGCVFYAVQKDNNMYPEYPEGECLRRVSCLLEVPDSMAVTPVQRCMYLTQPPLDEVDIYQGWVTNNYVTSLQQRVQHAQGVTFGHVLDTVAHLRRRFLMNGKFRLEFETDGVYRYGSDDAVPGVFEHHRRERIRWIDHASTAGEDRSSQKNTGSQ